MAPELVNIDYVFANTGDGDFEESIAFGGFEKNAFFLGESMTDTAIADLTTCRLSAAEFLDIVKIRGHVGKVTRGQGEETSRQEPISN